MKRNIKDEILDDIIFDMILERDYKDTTPQLIDEDDIDAHGFSMIQINEDGVEVKEEDT